MKTDLTHHPDLIECLAAGTLPDDPFASGRVMTDAPVVVSLKGAIQDALLHSTVNKKEKLSQFVPTGIACIDNRLGIGLEKGTSSIIGGFTSTGKSTLALGIANSNIRRGNSSLIFSVEDSSRLYGRRMLSMRTGIPSKVFRESSLSPSQIADCKTVLDTAEDTPFFINAKLWLPSKIALAMKWATRYYPSINLVIIDYMQELHHGSENKAKGMEDAMSMLRNTVSELDVAGIFLSQLTGDDKEIPGTYNMRDSKSISNAAENIILLWRNNSGEQKYVPQRHGGGITVPDGGTLAIMSKIKDGGNTGSELLEFNPKTQQFVDPDAGDYSGFSSGFDEKEEYFDDGFR